MAVLPGQRFGPYEVIAAVGAGGMGEVYRGRDTRLDRTVAIKVLPDSVARDSERLARFEREAKTLAALNHPNIAQIYGLEDSALAMEFVEGEDLSRRIARGPVPIEDALAIATQIADALGAAHHVGIVHRDLKPSNIRVRDDGTVKVLDFGLAKALAPAMDSGSGTVASTVTSPALTGLGAILGTAAYMAPEQAKGKPIDKRVDIWAFGVVLFEMITGRRPFDGDTVSEVIASVIKTEPALNSLPPRVRRLIDSCLEKDPARRLRDIGDWTRLLEAPGARPQVATSGSWLPWSVAALLAVAVGALGIAYVRKSPALPDVVRFEIPPPPGNEFDSSFALAPDGRSLAFIARDDKGTLRLWVRAFDSVQARAIPGTENARNVAWKPDGQAVAFSVGRALKTVSIHGGPVLTVCEVAAANALGGPVWSPTGVILFGGTTAGVMRVVSESGGPVRAVTALDPERRDLVHGLPSLLPDGRHFVYLRVSANVEQSAIFVGSLDRTPEEQEREPLPLAMEGRAIFSAMGNGRGNLLFIRQGTLMSQPFDVTRFALVGDPKPIAENVGNLGAQGFFSAVAGALAYRVSGAAGASRDSQLTWVDRRGEPVRAFEIRGPIMMIALAPDGHRAALTLSPNLNADIWLADLDRNVVVRLTTNPTADRRAVWSPDGSRLAFHSLRDGPANLFVMPANGPGGEERLLQSDRLTVATSWSHDGRFLLYDTSRPGTGNDVFALPMQGDRTPVPILATEFYEGGGHFSPDGRWIAYSSNVSRRMEIYVRAFDPASPGASASGVIQVSQNGGANPKWRRDGKELFFEAPDGTVMAVDITTSPTFVPGAVTPLFARLLDTAWDVAGDGSRFLVAVPTAEQRRIPITVVLNGAR